MRGKKYFYIGVVVFALIIGFFIGNYKVSSKKAEAEKYPFLSKRIFVEDQNDVLINFASLREQIKDYLLKTGIDHSFYFEYLPSGVSIRDGENNELVGASLMKLPLVMDLYFVAENGDININDSVTVVASDIDDKTGFGNTSMLKVGQQITLNEAVRLALTESDNTASNLILRTIKDKVKPEERVINYLDLETTSQDLGNNEELVYISSRGYASVLKCLYLSCFLSQGNSNEILQTLTESKNREKLPAGIPKDVPIANKIGVFQDKVQSDCGIIFEPKRPYLICLMFFTKDKDATNLNRYFKDISEQAYQYIKDQ